MYKELRPKTLYEFIGQEEITKVIRNIISATKCPECNATGIINGKKCKKCKGLGWLQRPPDLLFTGPPGVGKTTLAYIIAKELNAEIVELNASDDRGINKIREDIKIKSKVAGRRVFFLDEADGLTRDAQAALRRIIETSSKQTFFILSCNYVGKIIDAIQDRCVIMRFRKLTEEELQTIIINAIKYLVKEKGFKIKSSKEDLEKAIKLIVKFSNGSARQALNSLYDMISGDTIVISREVIEKNIVTPDISKEIIDFALREDLKGALERIETIAAKYRLDTNTICRNLLSAIDDKIEDSLLKQYAFSRLATLQYRLKFDIDPVIELIGFVADLILAKKGLMTLPVES